MACFFSLALCSKWFSDWPIWQSRKSAASWQLGVHRRALRATVQDARSIRRVEQHSRCETELRVFGDDGGRTGVAKGQQNG